MEAIGDLTSLRSACPRSLRMQPMAIATNDLEGRRRGVSEFRAAVPAGSPTGFRRMSGHPAVQVRILNVTQAALRNHHFDSLGLPDSMFWPRLNPIEPPWYATRMRAGVGGAAP
jgi:hypothetical protein